MSYPFEIQPLVIEDEQTAKEHYEAAFELLKSKYSIAPPIWAFSYDDGLAAATCERIYHLAIVDLRLPETHGRPHSDNLEFGLALVRSLANRNSFPIPALLVISGHLGLAKQMELDELVQASFAYGRVLAKSDHLEEEIESALSAVQRYSHIGIHIRDSGEKLFPSVTPRDEELLRRCVLKNEEAIGLDLSWWAAKTTLDSGWSKVLMGRFAFSAGRGHSLNTFFKLESSKNAVFVFKSASLCAQKLKHIKVVYSEIAGDTGLLVTQAAGSGDVETYSFEKFVRRNTGTIEQQHSLIAKQIAYQIGLLGDRTPDQTLVRNLFWKYHDVDRVKTQWLKYGGPKLLTELQDQLDCPISRYSKLLVSQDIVRFSKQSVLHGDLNYTNVALEDSSEGVKAFVFDAYGFGSGPSVSDLATLEVSLLLHLESEESLVSGLRIIFGQGWATDTLPPSATDMQQNVLRLVREIRNQAIQTDTLRVYALCVFDQCLVQLGGLAFRSSCNRINFPSDAAQLSALAAKWLDTSV
ncbi:MAG: hypothetical protein ABL921_08960 [Pirellula sp.]|jgi:hypothetical protein